MLVDGRYSSTDWGGVKEYLSEQEQQEFAPMRSDRVQREVQQFWDDVGSPDTSVVATASVRDTTIDSSTGGELVKSSPDASITTDNDGSRGKAATSGSDGTDTSTENTDTHSAPETEQVYFGKEASLSGWVEVPREVATETIVPMVEKNMVPEGEADHHDIIMMNFSQALSINGWAYLKAEAVTGEITQVVRETRVN